MLAVIALIVLVVIGAVIYFVMNKPKVGGLMEEGLKMAPDTTQIYIAGDLSSMYTAEQQQELVAALKDSQIFKKMSEEMKSEDLDLDKELMSWVKPAFVLSMAPLDGKPSVFTDIENADNKKAPFKGFLLLGVRDDAAAKASIEKMTGKGKIKFKNETYKGATIWTPEKGFEDGPTLTLAPGMFMLTLTIEDAKATLDHPAKNLSSADVYKTAMAKIKHQDGMVMFADLTGLLKAAKTSEIPEPEVKKLVEGLRTIAGGAGKDGKDLVSEVFISIDPAQAGKLAPIFFKPSFGIDMKSAEYFPADSEFYGSVNLKMVWTMIYDAMGEFPDYKQARDMPAQGLAQSGIDLQKDILDALTGELAYSITGYSKMFASQLESISSGMEPDPNQSVQELAQMPVVLALGLANKATLEGLINKQIPEPARAQFQKTDYNGVTIYGVQGQFFYGFTDDFMLVGINKAEDQMKKMIDAKKSGKNLKSLPGFGRMMGMLGSEKPIYFAYMDLNKVYGEAGNDLSKEDPGMGKALQLMSKAYPSSWQAGCLRNDGLYMGAIMMGQ